MSILGFQQAELFVSLRWLWMSLSKVYSLHQIIFTCTPIFKRLSLLSTYSLLSAYFRAICRYRHMRLPASTYSMHMYERVACFKFQSVSPNFKQGVDAQLWLRTWSFAAAAIPNLPADLMSINTYPLTSHMGLMPNLNRWMSQWEGSSQGRARWQ